MTFKTRTLMGAAAVCALDAAANAQTTVTLATVNNGDMIRMQGLTEDFTAQNPDITLEWVTLEENVMRQHSVMCDPGEYSPIVSEILRIV